LFHFLGLKILAEVDFTWLGFALVFVARLAFSHVL